MVLSPVVFGLVFCAALFHASWNAIVKSGEDRLVALAYAICVPGLICGAGLFFVPVPAPESWLYIFLSTVVHCGYYALLLTAYRHGDLSQVYPIARGAAPAMVAASAWLLVGEALEVFQILGLLVVCLGIVSLSRISPLARGRKERRDGETKAIFYAMLTAVTIACYTVVDGLGVRAAGTAPGYIFWLFFFEALPLGFAALWLRRHRLVAALRPQLKMGLLGGLIAGLAYGIVIWAMGVAPMAHVVALRETSVVLAAVIGTALLGEPFGRSRVFAAVLVMMGSVLLQLAR
jgi:drug/metabolite transporter (DMT)-like permease